MSSIDPDRALKRVVASLAQAEPEDIEAILLDLDTQTRTRVQSLLAAYHGAPPQPADQRRAHLEHLDVSPWLRDRLSCRGRNAMTPAALAALQDAAAGLPARAARRRGWRVPPWLGQLPTLAGARVRRERTA